MVELFKQNIRTNTRQSSKGNQLKWENESIWYKADYTGYEGLAEYVISHLLKYTNLNEDEYVLYEPEQIKYKRQIYNGVRSRAFIDGDWQIITLERLFKNVYNESLATVYKGNIIKNLIMDCQSYTKYRPNETTGGIFVSWRRKEELPTGA